MGFLAGVLKIISKHFIVLLYLSSSLWGTLLFAQVERPYRFAPGEILKNTKGIRYAIQKPIDRGGSGEVYLARVLGTHEKKIIKWNYTGQIPVRHVFNSKYLMDVDVVLVKDSSNNIIHLEVMEMGTPLAVILNGIPRHNIASLIKVSYAAMTHIIQSLRSLSIAGYVHNDVKTGNILFLRDGFVLLDYDRITHKLYPEMVTEGSVIFMNPEQRFEKPTGLFSDYYSLGVTLLDILGCLDPVDPSLSANDFPLVEAAKDAKIQKYLKILRKFPLNPESKKELEEIISFIEAVTTVNLEDRARFASNHFQIYPLQKQSYSCIGYFY